MNTDPSTTENELRRIYRKAMKVHCILVKLYELTNILRDNGNIYKITHAALKEPIVLAADQINILIERLSDYSEEQTNE